MKDASHLGMSARIILALTLLLFSLSLPLTIENGQAFATTPNTEIPQLKSQSHLTDNLIQVDSWYDNFDSYATGSSLQGQGGWKGWANSPAPAAFTSDEQAISTPNSVDIAPAADTVHEYSGYTSGEWIYTAWQYIPTDFAGESYFILLNQYDDAGTTLNWSVQVKFDSVTSQIENTGNSVGILPLIKDAWVQLRIEIDLNNDTCVFYYGGQRLYTGTWTDELTGGGILNIAAVDLFANGASSIYYDDLSLTPKLGWSDNFDSYATGSSLQGQGGWKGWQNNPAAAALTSDEQALSTPNSADIAPAADTVHEYSGYIAGEWVYTALQYIPTEFTGVSYFILLNQFDDAGNTLNWSVQVSFSSSTNQVLNTGITGGTLPLIKGEWVELRVEIDFTDDVCAFYYGGQLLYEATWTDEVSGSGIANLAAVDLFANGASSIYYDDLSLTPPQSLLYLPLIVR